MYCRISALLNPSSEIVFACSTPMTRMVSPAVLPGAAMFCEIVLRMPSAVLFPWSLTVWGPAPAKMVTVLSSASKPRSTCNGSQGLSSSFSAMQQVYFPACPNAERSSSPGNPPPMLVQMSRSVRPIVAFARHPCPKRLNPSLISNCFRIGPFTTSIGETWDVVT